MFDLIVTSAFGEYSKGDKITDHAEITAILAGPHSVRVVRVPADEVGGDQQNSEA